MFNSKHNPNLKDVKFESSDDAIKRGLKVQTSFLSKREAKSQARKTKSIVDAKHYNNDNDCYNADTYRQMLAIGIITKQ